MADLRAASRQHDVVVNGRAADAESFKQRRWWRSKHARPTTPLLRTLAVMCWGRQWTREHSIPVDCIRSLWVIILYAPLLASTRLPRCCAAPSFETLGRSHNPASRHKAQGIRSGTAQHAPIEDNHNGS
jgi:hypothetical protein